MNKPQTLLKVLIKNIPLEGLRLEREVPGEDLGFEHDEIRLLSSVHVDALVEKAKDEIIANVAFQADYEFTCARCLTPVVRHQRDKAVLYFDIDPTTEEIDMAEDIRQEMVLALNPVILCRPDCRGLCPNCGADLNQESCRCHEKRKKPKIQVRVIWADQQTRDDV